MVNPPFTCLEAFDIIGNICRKKPRYTHIFYFKIKIISQNNRLNEFYSKDRVEKNVTKSSLNWQAMNLKIVNYN